MTKFNLGQRIVIVGGWGAIVDFFGFWVTTFNSPFGWVAFAPLSNSTYLPGGLSPGARLLVWLGLVLVWTGGSVLVFRPLNLAQRVVMVIGWGLALAFFGRWVATIGYPYGLPIRVSQFSQIQPLPAWGLTLVWIGLAIVWVAGAVWLLRSPTDTRK